MESALTQQLTELCGRARRAARTLAAVGRADKDRALRAIADRLRATAEEGARSAVLQANAADVAAAHEAGLAEALVDRLVLDEKRLGAMAAAVLEVASFDDPVGEVLGMKRRPNGLLIGQVRIPLGVIAMIYESRPNVTVDAAALCLKSGNAALLRGGKEAARSNEALGVLVREAVASAGLPADAVQVVPPLGREETRILVGLTGMIDLVIPRGGEGLIRFVAEHASVPVIQHYKGVCHLYVDQGADLDMAMRLVDNGKMSRPGVCNALECLLVHEDEASKLLPRLGALVDRGLEIRGDEATRAVLPAARPASKEDFGQEFLAPILAVRVVGSMDAALEHIAEYGSQHTEAICTPSYERAQRFLREVDASCVLVNASTRFNDGGELGLGAEIGISTTKLHAYGPMGLESLTARKWIAYGEGQIR
ncbi:glutamate-5-semialdehyde dehydrogenase [Polyangium aurulentum]|uniref:glutamate-5-semialdehyde dehydrogenase n=1 Tax=Polyangium aurulentum TaxID=2567896 RepID=UPI0010AE76C1|nr:glutamate-5-semialdehyde dehydrogenase [Polyangium aurulentum]UQA56310.1 glutamate-5-semialdehyde dehydrogenase [Polyangium aurulentum]